MKILFLSQWYPYPPNNGSKIRIYNLLRGLSRDHGISLLSFIDPLDRRAADDPLKDLCSDVNTAVWKPFNPNSLRSITGFFNSEPRSVMDIYSREMANKIQNQVLRHQYDLVVASQITMAGYAECFRGIPAVWDEVETGVFYQQVSRATPFFKHLRSSLTWAKHRSYLSRLVHSFQACTVASEVEKGLLHRIAPDYGNIEVIPNFIEAGNYEADRLSAKPVPFSMIFCGSFRYRVNYEAAAWFLKEAYPVIQASFPEARLTITGDTAGLPLPPAANVDTPGYIEDIRPFVANSWVSIAPILVGGGTRLKILEAMALGTPVVSTAKGAEGLDVIPGEHLLIGDTPEDFADAVVRLFGDPLLRQKLAANAHQLVKRNYDSGAVLPKFQSLIWKAASHREIGQMAAQGADDR